MAHSQPKIARQECMISAHCFGPGQFDDWAPNYANQRVRLLLQVNLDTLGANVAIWGADDLAAERTCDLSEALDLYVRFAQGNAPPLVSLLSKWGFSRF